MSADENRALVRRYYQEVANVPASQASTAAEGLLTTDFVFYPPNDTEGMRSLEAHKGFLAWHHGVAPDLHWTVEELITEVNTVVCRFTAQGTQQGEFLGVPPSDRHFTLRGVDIFRIVDGRLSELRRYFDVLSMMQEIGGIPGGVNSE